MHKSFQAYDVSISCDVPILVFGVASQHTMSNCSARRLDVVPIPAFPDHGMSQFWARKLDVVPILALPDNGMSSPKCLQMSPNVSKCLKLSHASCLKMSQHVQKCPKMFKYVKLRPTPSHSVPIHPNLSGSAIRSGTFRPSPLKS